MKGICTLGNDYVFDQLVALLNSIDVFLGSEIPVCIYPFDEQTQRIAQEIAKRPNVFLYDDQESIQRWDQFMLEASPASMTRKYRIYGGHRRFCAFDAPFDEFVYLDADTLVMDSLDLVFQKLAEYDCVVYDFQFKHPDKVYNIESSKLLQVFDPERLEKEVFCSGFYASKKGLFAQSKIDKLLSYLQAGEREILYPTGDQPVLNYMFMRSGLRICNLAHHLDREKVTGCTVTSKHFEDKDHILYDKGNRLTYLHYIGIHPRIHQAVCTGDNIEFPYRDLFLYYRYLHEPDKRPSFTTPPLSPHTPAPNLLTRALRKFKLIKG
ncbi:sugar transferase [Sphaerospermopsis aphanizomenoides BCCUSP55]|uniref:Npun_R2821/Npun_R2822 family protein n=1 Tax=Sphaerospermopsis aphanizomenoides TaxID=459663 RepID=UPI000A8D2B1F|nr:Npun_R2821/Npun_R2822 family protein [Sphaerospermopsis aphanizomenoides]MBK1987210.1 sugar transferase [Sphaerospermopsis aphanizomenoides BCCUSP55]